MKLLFSQKSVGLLLFVAIMLSHTNGHAQKIMLKTNALEWLCLTPNAGLETRLSRSTTLNLEGAGTSLNFGQKRLRHVTFRPELRYWFSGRPQAHHFVGLMALGSVFDVKLNSADRHKGVGLGLGATYGYSYVVSKHFSIEGSLGAGVISYRERAYDNSGNEVEGKVYREHTRLFPLKLGISAVYMF